jgi:hypothetical protein
MSQKTIPLVRSGILSAMTVHHFIVAWGGTSIALLITLLSVWFIVSRPT